MDHAARKGRQSLTSSTERATIDAAPPRCCCSRPHPHATTRTSPHAMSSSAGRATRKAKRIPRAESGLDENKNNKRGKVAALNAQANEAFDHEDYATAEPLYTRALDNHVRDADAERGGQEAEKQ